MLLVVTVKWGECIGEGQSDIILGETDPILQVKFCTLYRSLQRALVKSFEGNFLINSASLNQVLHSFPCSKPSVFVVMGNQLALGTTHLIETEEEKSRTGPKV